MKRFDVQKLDGFEVTPQGFLRIPVYAARTGIQLYRKNDGTALREYRPPEEVFSERTMASLRCCPMTNNHPKEMVNADNAKDLVGGFTVDHVEKVDNRFLKTYVVIFDRQMIDDIQAGKREVSMGYDVDVEFTPGEVDGQKYDAVQRNIVHNHIALVDRARGGREVRLRLDGEDAVLVTEQDNEPGGTMPKITIGDKEFEVAQDLHDAFDSFCNEMNSKMKKGDEAVAQAAELDGKVKALSTEKEALQGKVDALEDEKKKAPTQKVDAAAIEEAVRERRKIERVASKLLKKEDADKMDSLSNLELKKAVISVECPEAKFDGKTEAYISARFDHIADTLDASEKANSEAGKKIVDGRKKDGESEKTDASEARKKAMEESAKAWQKPVGKSKNQ
jgi:hypothetical protein